MAVSNIRMPDEVYERLKERAREENRSINDVTVEILEREMKRWAGLRALAKASEIREQIRARFGELPDSTEEIRRLREERSNRG